MFRVNGFVHKENKTRNRMRYVMFQVSVHHVVLTSFYTRNMCIWKRLMTFMELPASLLDSNFWTIIGNVRSDS